MGLRPRPPIHTNACRSGTLPKRLERQTRVSPPAPLSGWGALATPRQDPQPCTTQESVQPAPPGGLERGHCLVTLHRVTGGPSAPACGPRPPWEPAGELEDCGGRSSNQVPWNHRHVLSSVLGQESRGQRPGCRQGAVGPGLSQPLPLSWRGFSPCLCPRFPPVRTARWTGGGLAHCETSA